MRRRRASGSEDSLREGAKESGAIRYVYGRVGGILSGHVVEEAECESIRLRTSLRRLRTVGDREVSGHREDTYGVNPTIFPPHGVRGDNARGDEF